MQRPGPRQILQALVQGFDPFTGDELPPDTVLQQAEVIRALLAGLTALEASAARAQRRSQLPANVGVPWTDDEERQLVAEFSAGESVHALARSHGRTATAIEARLEKLGLITGDQRITSNRFIAARRAAHGRKAARDAGVVPKDGSEDGPEDAPEDAPEAESDESEE